MKIGFGQILIIFLICILLFSDINNIKKNFYFYVNKLKIKILKNKDDRKKGA